MVRRIWLLLAITFANMASAHADDKSRTSGFALGTAVGSDNVFLGAHALYYLQVPDSRFRVAFRVGGGVFSNQVKTAGAAFGVMGVFGRNHRMVVDLHTAPMGYQRLVLHGAELDVHPLYGIGLSLGYEWMASYGLFLRANIGPAYVFLPPIYRARDGITVTGNIVSAGYKLW
jgi:hypothetical protein